LSSNLVLANDGVNPDKVLAAGMRIRQYFTPAKNLNLDSLSLELTNSDNVDFHQFDCRVQITQGGTVIGEDTAQSVMIYQGRSERVTVYFSSLALKANTQYALNITLPVTYAFTLNELYLTSIQPPPSPLNAVLGNFESYDLTLGSTSFLSGSLWFLGYGTVEPPPAYSVTYQGNGATGGSVPVDSKQYEENMSVTVLANTGNLVRTNYTFRGWSTNPSASTPAYTVSGSTVTPPSFTMGVSNVVLYAVWEALPAYTVTYMPNWPGGSAGSGSVPTDSANYTTGSTVTVRANPGNLAKAGYIFRGWATSSSASNPNYTVTGSTVSPSSFTMGTANVTLYAVWEVLPTYRVIYNANWPGGSAGTGSVPTDSADYLTGTSVTVRANTGNLAKAGYTFRGWATTNNAANPNYTVTGSTVSPSSFTMGSANVVLFAVWAVLVYSVGFSVSLNAQAALTRQLSIVRQTTPYLTLFGGVNRLVLFLRGVSVNLNTSALLSRVSVQLRGFRAGLGAAAVFASLSEGLYGFSAKLSLSADFGVLRIPVLRAAVFDAGLSVQAMLYKRIQLTRRILSNLSVGASLQRRVWGVRSYVAGSVVSVWFVRRFDAVRQLGAGLGLSAGWSRIFCVLRGFNAGLSLRAGLGRGFVYLRGFAAALGLEAVFMHWFGRLREGLFIFERKKHSDIVEEIL